MYGDMQHSFEFIQVILIIMYLGFYEGKKGDLLEGDMEHSFECIQAILVLMQLNFYYKKKRFVVK